MTSITKQLEFLNSHCFIVCSYCSVVCLIAKNELKMIEFSSSLKLNEIHTVDSLLTKIPKISCNFLQGGPNFWEGRSENGQ